MNTQPGVASAAQRAQVRPNSSGSAISPTSPTSPHQRGLLRGGPGVRRRTINDAFGNGIKIEPSQQSPTSAEEGFEEKDESRIGVKRACNECRQQKLRCDVVQDPFQPCTRCKRCKLDCKIDTNFKRIGKRKRNAEMEQEIVELRKQLEHYKASFEASQIPPAAPHGAYVPTSSHGLPIPQIGHPPLSQYMGSQEEAVASLLDLRSGGERVFGKSPAPDRGPDGKPTRRLGDVTLTQTQTDELFQIFFKVYHPFQPLLEQDKDPNYYFEQCPLLYWTTISVAARHNPPASAGILDIAKGLNSLLWTTIAEVPQSYLVVKALCMLCVWPLPISSTTSDPTLMISGLMLQIAMQIGLHRPTHAQDFSKYKVDLRDEELRDRVKTWAACNVIAQRVATGYGQLACTHYDWTLQASFMKESGFKLPDEMDTRLRIEMFSDKITKNVYGNLTDPVGLVDHQDKDKIIKNLANELQDLEETHRSNLHPVNKVYLLATKLHLRLSVFFDPPTSSTYKEDLMHLWNATREFLEGAFNLSTATHDDIIKYSTGYILQMIIASGFCLLRLLNSFFKGMIDLDHGKKLFVESIQAIRQISCVKNDLPARLAEVLAQLWKFGGEGLPPSPSWDGSMDDTLQLRVRCRMSMSHVFDSVWRWREDFQAKGRGNLENAMNNPTNPDSASISTVGTTSSTMPSLPSEIGTTSLLSKNLDSMLMPNTSGSVSRAPTPAFSGEFGFGGEYGGSGFDYMSWMLDNFADFPYSMNDGQDIDLGAIQEV